MPGHCLVITTAPDQNTAETLAATILDAGLAACIQLIAIQSHYLWKGKREQTQEIALHIKTTTASYPWLETCIKASHPYELPEIIMLPVIAGEQGYLDWITTAITTSPSPPASP